MDGRGSLARPMSRISSQYTEVGRHKIHYLCSGNGDPVILIHGFPTSSHLWRNVIPELARSHRVIALDLPGYGRSDKPLNVEYSFRFFEDTLDAFLDELGISRTALVVHDLGGPVGLFWAVRNSERLSKLVILNTLVYPETSWAVKAFLIALQLPLVREYVVSPKGIVGAMKLGVVRKDRLDREVLAPYTAPFNDAASRQALIKAGSGLSVKGLGEIARKLPELQVPVRIIYGKNDRFLPDIAKTAARLKKDIPAAEVTPLGKCGHFLQEDEPEQVSRLIAGFLNS